MHSLLLLANHLPPIENQISSHLVKNKHCIFHCIYPQRSELITLESAKLLLFSLPQVGRISLPDLAGWFIHAVRNDIRSKKKSILRAAPPVEQRGKVVLHLARWSPHSALPEVVSHVKHNLESLTFAMHDIKHKRQQVGSHGRSMICHGSQPISLGRLEHFCAMIHLRSLDQKSIYWHFSDPSSASET